MCLCSDSGCFIIGGFNQKLHGRYERACPSVSKEAVALTLVHVPGCARESSRTKHLISLRFLRVCEATSKDLTGEKQELLRLDTFFFFYWNASLERSQRPIWFGSRACIPCVCVCVWLVNPPNFLSNSDQRSSQIYRVRSISSTLFYYLHCHKHRQSVALFCWIIRGDRDLWEWFSAWWNEVSTTSPYVLYKEGHRCLLNEIKKNVSTITQIL